MYPSWVEAGAADAFQTVVATLEAIGSANALDPAVTGNFSLAVALSSPLSASVPAATTVVRGWLAAATVLYNAIPLIVTSLAGVDPSVPAGCLALAEGLVKAMDPAASAAAFAAAFDAATVSDPPSSGTPNRIAFAQNAIAITRFSRFVYLSAYAEAIVLTPFPARSDAIGARADLVSRFEQELWLCQGAADAAVADALIAVRDAAVAYLTQAIINGAPVLEVTGPALPALFQAWRIYQDPSRAAELLALNAVAVAEFMPTVFEAIAPPSFRG